MAAERALWEDAVGAVLRAGHEVIGAPPDPQGAAPRLIRHAHYDVIALGDDVPPEAREWLTAEGRQFLPRSPLIGFSAAPELLDRRSGLDPVS